MNEIEREKFINMVRQIVRSEIDIWRHPDDQELQDLWNKKIDRAIDSFEREIGDGK